VHQLRPTEKYELTGLRIHFDLHTLLRRLSQLKANRFRRPVLIPRDRQRSAKELLKALVKLPPIDVSQLDPLRNSRHTLRHRCFILCRLCGGTMAPSRQRCNRREDE
jgi:hypothetical protein